MNGGDSILIKKSKNDTFQTPNIHTPFPTYDKYS